MTDIIIIAGAPGSGKTTVSELLREKFNSPLIDYGHLRQFHLDRGWKNQSVVEERMTFENLVGILKNYVKYGYKNVIVNDLKDSRVMQIPQILKDYNYVIFTLIVKSSDELKRRITNLRNNGYTDYQSAIEWNRHLQDRETLKNEYKIDNTHSDPQKTVDQVLKILSHD